VKTVEEYLKIYCDNHNANSLLELFLIEVREKIIDNLDRKYRFIPQKYIDVMQLLDDRWKAVADITKNTDKPLNRKSLSTSIKVYYPRLYRRWKGLKKSDVVW